MPIFSMVAYVLVGSIDAYYCSLGNEFNGVVVRIRVLFWSDLACQLVVCSWWGLFWWEILFPVLSMSVLVVDFHCLD